MADRNELTRQAVSATLHCLTGCAIGEVLGMVLATWWGWADAPSIALAVVLAFLFGYAFSMRPVLRAGVRLGTALGVVLAADTLSITVMEIVDNAVILAVPGAMEAGLTDVLFWGALALGLALAFVVTVPVNRWMIARGKGHALAHQYHHGHHEHAGHEHAGHEHAGHEHAGHEHAGHEHAGHEQSDRSDRLPS